MVALSVEILPRSAWGAQPAWGNVASLNEPHKGSVLHWEGGSGSMVGVDPASTLRQIQQQCKNNGYSDIFYSFAVSLDGRCWECRGWNKNSGANGNTEANSWYYAVCILMNVNDTPTQAALNTAGEMLDWIGGQVYPHSHFFATQCPGDELRVWLSQGYPHDVPLPIDKDDFDMPADPQVLAKLDTIISLLADASKPGIPKDIRDIGIRTQDLVSEVVQNTKPKA